MRENCLIPTGIKARKGKRLRRGAAHVTPEEGTKAGKEGKSSWPFTTVAIAAARLVNKSLASPGL